MAKGKPWTVEDERQLRQLLTEKKSMRTIAKILGKTLTSVQMKTSRLGLVVDDEGEKNTPSSSTFDKLVLPIESCRRRYSVQLWVWDGATLALKKNIEWTWAPNINGASYVSSVAIEDVDDDGKNEISTGGYNDGTRNVAQLCVWNGATLVLKNVETWYWKRDVHQFGCGWQCGW